MVESYVDYQEFIAKKETFYMRQAVPLKQIKQMNMSVEKFDSLQFEEMIYQVSQSFLELETCETVQVPTTWWQAFKEQLYPKWAQKIFVIKHREIETKRVRVCSHYSLPENESHMRWLGMDRVEAFTAYGK